MGEATKIHSLAELQQLEELLAKAFRRICLAGDFTLVFVAQEKGSSESKGLTLFGVTKNSVNIAFQPGSNDTRFSYGIPLPNAEMAMDVHRCLDEVLKQQVAEAEGKRPTLALVPKAPSVNEVPEPVATEARVHARVAEVQAGSELIMVEFDASLDGTTPFDELKHQLLAVLARHGSEGLFTVKKGETSSTCTASSVGIQWCILQPGASGIGFWFRESLMASWHKYALVPESSFDLELFAEEVQPKKSQPHAPNVKGILHHDAPRASIMDYAEDVSLYTRFLTRMAEEMQRNSVLEMPSSEMTRIFAELVNESFAGRSVGMLLRRWDEKGLLRRIKKYESSGNYVYSFGLSAAALLPAALQGLAPKRTVLAPTAKPLVRAPMVKPAADVAAAPLSAMPKVAQPVVSTGNAVADALELLTQQEQRIAEAKATLSQFVEASGKLKVIDAELASIDDQIKALLQEGKALKEKRDELVKQLPSEEVVAAMMQSLCS